MHKLTDPAAWQALQRSADALRNQSIATLAATDPRRAADFRVTAAELTLDYSRQRLSREARDALLAFARQRDLQGGIKALFAGEHLNRSEDRAALHMALRAPAQAGFALDGVPVGEQVEAVRQRMAAFATALRGGEWRGGTGAPITDVVNIGIGGSDRGPRLVCEALAHVADGPRTHFIANLDAALIKGLLRQLDPATTLFIVVSKTFTTAETLSNAELACAWLRAELGENALARHLVAVTASPDRAQQMGIAADNVFPFWDWVGGRFSLWSAVGLAAWCALGPARMMQLLEGAHAMDTHFAATPLADNLPVWLALTSFWQRTLLGMSSEAIFPYAQALAALPGYLQQLEMESLGKRVDVSGKPLQHATAPVIWGDVGSDAQHAVMQWLHQGAGDAAVEFILPLQGSHDDTQRHLQLVANCLAQAAVLMNGLDGDAVQAQLSQAGLAPALLAGRAPHCVLPGNHGSNLLFMPALEPHALGALLAAYEHKTFVLGWLWGINPFDQWGVEHGKRMAGQVAAALSGAVQPGLDALTRASVDAIRAEWETP